MGYYERWGTGHGDDVGGRWLEGSERWCILGFEGGFPGFLDVVVKKRGARDWVRTLA